MPINFLYMVYNQDPRWPWDGLNGGFFDGHTESQSGSDVPITTPWENLSAVIDVANSNQSYSL